MSHNLATPPVLTESGAVEPDAAPPAVAADAMVSALESLIASATQLPDDMVAVFLYPWFEHLRCHLEQLSAPVPDRLQQLGASVGVSLNIAL